MESGISTYIDFSGNGGFTIRLYLEEQWDAVSNYSVVSVTGMSVRSETYRGTWYPGGSVSINGAAVCVMDYNNPATHTFNAAGTSTGWASVVATSKGQKFPWSSGNISHNSDGSKSVSVSVNVKLWRSSSDPILLVSGSSTLTLTTIPRTSYVSGSSGTLGAKHTLTITRQSSSFTETLVATCGRSSVTIANKTSSKTVTWTPPAEWESNTTDGATVSVTITCTTYSGNTKIGTSSIAIAFAISTGAVPTVSISVSDAKGYTSKYGGYIQGQSIANVKVNASGAHGSSITECTVTLGGTTKTGTTVEMEIPQSGVVTITATATDSRGRTGTAATTINVIAYTAPTAIVSTAYRSDENGNQADEGEYATVLFKANISPLNNSNSAQYAIKYRRKGMTAWTTIEIPENLGYSPDSISKIFPANVNYLYEVCAVAKDDFVEVTSIYRTVSTAFYLISVHRDHKSVGIGQKATDYGMCGIGIPLKINAGIYADNRVLDIVYEETIGAYVLKALEAR